MGINEAGLTIVREERCRLSRTECEEFYAEHSERPFFPGLVKFMSGGDVVKLELQGENAVRRWRELIGPTNSETARKEAASSIRALYGKDNQRNAAHGSDSLESAARELALISAEWTASMRSSGASTHSSREASAGIP